VIAWDNFSDLSLGITSRVVFFFVFIIIIIYLFTIQTLTLLMLLTILTILILTPTILKQTLQLEAEKKRNLIQ